MAIEPKEYYFPIPEGFKDFTEEERRALGSGICSQKLEMMRKARLRQACIKVRPDRSLVSPIPFPCLCQCSKIE